MKTLFLVRRGGGLQVRRLIQFQTKFFALELWGRQFEVGVPAGILILDTLELTCVPPEPLGSGHSPAQIFGSRPSLVEE